jgi:hypothetical protein
LMPTYLLGPWARELYTRSPIAIRDRYLAHPLYWGVAFAGQRMAARIMQMLRGKDAIWRNEAKARAAHDCCYRYHDACGRCSLRNICDGFHGDYSDLFGTAEAQPITDRPLTDDPKCCIQHQDKTVEPEDDAWAL